MSVKVTHWVWVQNIKPATKIVLLAIADNAHDDGDNAYPGQKLLAAKANMSVRSVVRHLEWLERNNYLRRIRRSRADGTRTSDRYVVLIERQHAKLASSQPAQAAGRPKRQHANGGRDKMTLLAGQ